VAEEGFGGKEEHPGGKTKPLESYPQQGSLGVQKKSGYRQFEKTGGSIGSGKMMPSL